MSEILWWEETLFKDESVFDPEYLPDVIFHREKQIDSLVMCMYPATRKSRPMDVLCVGPPSTGKTTTVRYVLEQLSKEYNVAVAYLKCPTLRTKYNVFARLYEIVCKKLAPQKGVPLYSLLDDIFKTLDKTPFIVVLDDINFLETRILNEVLLLLLKAAREDFGAKVGVIGTATSLDFMQKLDPYVGSIFHFYKIDFPPYTKDEIRDILRWRVEHGFQKDVLQEDAFERIVELTSKTGDIRYGLFLLRNAGLNAEKRASRKIELQDVESVTKDETKVLLAKAFSALNSDEREVLKIIYSLDGEITAGTLFSILKREVGMHHERFYEILNKLERLRFIDVVFDKKGRGWTRYILRRYEKSKILDALKEF